MVNYECKLCNFMTHRKTNLERHKLTKKHLKNELIDEPENKIETVNIKPVKILKCQHCDIIFKHRQNLHRHINKRCKHNPNLIKNTHCLKKDHNEMIEQNNELMKQNNELMKQNNELMKQNKKLMKQIKSLETKKTKQKPKTHIHKSLKNKVWEETYGTECGKHECYIGCGKMISQGDFECGHIMAESKGGPTNRSNLKPICSQCNKSMGTMNLEEYKLKFN